MVRAHGLVPTPLQEEDVIDQRTWKAKGHVYIRDDAFFQLLGVPMIRALDRSNYEGAEIIQDLNKPVPPHFEHSTDFILDGSTLDNLFSPSTAIQSIARMLRPGGRFLSVSTASFHTDEYTVVSPYWFLDFFAVNRFADCRVYVTTHGDRGELNVYSVDPLARRDRAFRPVDPTGFLIFAEKGPESTWDELPSQRFYCGPDEIEARIALGRGFVANERPELLFSVRPKPFRRLRVAKYILAAENRTAEDFKMVANDGRKVHVPVPATLGIARRIRKLVERLSGKRVS